MKLAKPLFAPHTSPVERVWYFALRGLAVLTLLYLILPVLAIVPLSFSSSTFLVYPIPGWSLRWYQNLIASDEWRMAAKNSFIVAPSATIVATLQGFNYNLVRASLSLGANPVKTFFRITLPVIAPGVISGALFAFATSFDEVVVTLFLAGADQTTLPRQMFTGIRENISPTIAALATILIVFSTGLLLALEL